MAGIYIHIPFCKQACHYCNFHFATSLRHTNELVAALLRETELRQEYFGQDPVETIYFGGGTPSLLEIEDLRLQIDKIKAVYNVSGNAEITLETNPDDINEEKLSGWKEIGINRLSAGVQSFFDEDLQWMNRAHTAQQAMENLQLARTSFDNITIDLIYGMPELSNDRWKQNVDTAISFNIPHLSCYALTVEEKTPLHKMIKLNKAENINPDKQSEQFLLLMQWLEETGYEHYEISNFSKPGYQSRHNSSYWQGKKYLGIGPSAHSFDGNSRQWNISNNQQYIESINKGIIPFEKEILTSVQKLNEYIMTSLRTIEGIDLNKIPGTHRVEIQDAGKKYIDGGLMISNDQRLMLTRKGKLLADGIAADLFFDQ
ncbi:MAG TPA: radical SAM family heme chaperone HemW [Chitinophagaceae bacterium]|nr:radical SAM family heme chaperone HemW [Chitinophagaceae bacterium]